MRDFQDAFQLGARGKASGVRSTRSPRPGPAGVPLGKRCTEVGTTCTRSLLQTLDALLPESRAAVAPHVGISSPLRVASDALCRASC